MEDSKVYNGFMICSSNERGGPTVWPFKSHIRGLKPDNKEIRRKILEDSVVLLSLSIITGGLVRIPQCL